MESEKLLTIDEIKNHLIIDELDNSQKKDLERLIKVADEYLQGSIGKDYPRNSERAKQIALFIIEDLYDRSSLTINESRTLKKMKNDFAEQLRLEKING